MATSMPSLHRLRPTRRSGLAAVRGFDWVSFFLFGIFGAVFLALSGFWIYSECTPSLFMAMNVRIHTSEPSKVTPQVLDLIRRKIKNAEKSWRPGDRLIVVTLMPNTGNPAENPKTVKERYKNKAYKDIFTACLVPACPVHAARTY